MGAKFLNRVPNMGLYFLGGALAVVTLGQRVEFHITPHYTIFPISLSIDKLHKFFPGTLGNLHNA